MIKGKTKSGFEFHIEEEVLDDYEILEDLCAIDEGEANKIPKVAIKILGDEQMKKLKDHIRGENGRASALKMGEAIGEILTGCNEGKNS